MMMTCLMGLAVLGEAGSAAAAASRPRGADARSDGDVQSACRIAVHIDVCGSILCSLKMLFRRLRVVRRRRAAIPTPCFSYATAERGARELAAAAYRRHATRPAGGDELRKWDIR